MSEEIKVALVKNIEEDMDHSRSMIINTLEKLSEGSLTVDDAVRALDPSLAVGALNIMERYEGAFRKFLFAFYPDDQRAIDAINRNIELITHMKRNVLVNMIESFPYMFNVEALEIDPSLECPPTTNPSHSGEPYQNPYHTPTTNPYQASEEPPLPG